MESLPHLVRGRSERSTHPSTPRHIPKDLNPMWDPIRKSPWELYNLKWGPLLWIWQPYIARLSPHCVHNSTPQNLTGGSWIHPQLWKTTTFTRYALILLLHVCLHRTTVMPFNIFIPLYVLHVSSIISLYVTILINQQRIKIENLIITLVPLTFSWKLKNALR